MRCNRTSATRTTTRLNSARGIPAAGSNSPRAYTYSKSLDQSSNIGEEVNPFNPALSYALSSFDVKHNFVLSYEYQLPIDG